jgi:hypothetical protein
MGTPPSPYVHTVCIIDTPPCVGTHCVWVYGHRSLHVRVDTVRAWTQLSVRVHTVWRVWRVSQAGACAYRRHPSCKNTRCTCTAYLTHREDLSASVCTVGERPCGLGGRDARLHRGAQPAVPHRGYIHTPDSELAFDSPLTHSGNPGASQRRISLTGREGFLCARGETTPGPRLRNVSFRLRNVSFSLRKPCCITCTYDTGRG